ncbi:MAG: CPBP family intramembrane metalloprotease [Planctomycetota bacterium]|nr:MAG: CPBP family intramembrane metalloprotease [Planctomycetota bacterium]REK26560.1 MAG: CPBP family intramembrane metalloprotease [Planctomycetota bacterium]REK34047.1 MAG: CPBP family intramembrane metalloprotease [Planctomycetota bacterium]
MDFDSRSSFLNFAGLLQGGLVFAAVLLGWLTGLPPLQQIRLNLMDVLVGCLGVLPMLVVFATARNLRTLVVELLGEPLSLCTWYDLLLLAALAGLGEELMFRGVLQPWIGRIHPLAGLIAANVIFGLLHALTPGYAILAALFGFYLSLLTAWPGEANLLRPIVTHAVYDYIAFLLVVREYRRRSGDGETGA